MIGDRLKEFADKNFGSVNGLERALGMNRNSLSQYVYNRNTPGSNLLIKLRELGCDINWLLTGEGEISKARAPDENSADRIRELEEENRLLRDRLSQISNLTQAVEELKKRKRKR